jgi:hypothetical protein
VFAILATYAFTCADLRYTNKNNKYFFDRKEKKKKVKEEKKICKLKSNAAAAVKVFWKKYYPKRSAGVEIFYKNPQGLTFTAGKRNC